MRTPPIRPFRCRLPHAKVVRLGVGADKAVRGTAGGWVTGLEALACVGVAEDPAVAVGAAITVLGATAHGARTVLAAGLQVGPVGIAADG